METQIAHNVLEVFTENTGLKAKWKAVRALDKHKGFDGQVDIRATAGDQVFFAEVKTIVTLPNIPELLKLHNLNKNILVMADEILPEVRKYLKSVAINYLDAAGNAYLKTPDLIIFLEHNKPKDQTIDYKIKPFSKTGLKVIYHLFTNEGLINATIRDIAVIAGVSLDTVHKTINGLKQLNYLLPLTKEQLTWHNKKELLQRWVAEFGARLKPSLNLGTFRFVNDQDFYKWKELDLDNTLTRWGGEAAGELLTDYLKPEKLTLYTFETKLALIKKLKIVPDPIGVIELYEKFWNQDDPATNTVHPLLAYTDLINSGNSRNIETANKIYGQYLQSGS